ncbi:MAG: dTDP-4-dehydrorhamnose reductase [Succinivibrio sp.]|nr:dTDP-4-dehydrorhamnose reductase [Succinivibrio sp.]
MSRILVTGANGQVGQELVNALMIQGYEVIAAGHADLDITSEAAVEGCVGETGIDAVINSAAYTAVDRAENDRTAAHLINAQGPRYLAAACQKAQIPLIHISTDYVLDTVRGEPHLETERPRASCVYGSTKLEGENFIKESGCNYLIFRISWVFGRFGRNFVKTMLRLGTEREEIAVVSDELGAPTPARAFAEALALIMGQVLQPNFKDYGIYHYCGTPFCSWSQFARDIFECADSLNLLPHAVNVRDISAREYGATAARPADSRLNTDKFSRVFGIAMPDWHDYLQETLNASA